MELNHFERAETLFHRAMSLQAEDRDAFIHAESQGDEALAQRVRRLIRFADSGAPTGGLRPVLPTDVADDVPDTLLDATIGRYHIIRRIGEGGFGVVYEAEQLLPMQRRVAVKILRSGMDSKRVISRFSAERQALAKMDHPNIARIFDAGQTEPALGSRPYFVMEYVEGEPLTEYCNKHELDCADRLELCMTVCHAVQHAHQKGIIHRDLKPSNILVTEVDGVATPKVIDFGIAKATQQDGIPMRTQMTEAQQLLGTPQYMSPEQADFDASSIDTRTDIYSLGVVLYELLTNSTPFFDTELQHASYAKMQQVIRTQHIDRPSVRVARTASTSPETARQRHTDAHTLQRKLKGDLDWIVLKALEPDRDRRYNSAAAFAEDIRRHLKHEPVLAGPPGAMYRAGKFIRRHRVGTAASALISLAIFVGLIGVTMGLVRMRSAAEQTTAINEFMHDVLTSAAPDKLGVDVRLVDVLRNGTKSASQRFAGHPESEAQVRTLLGQVYLALDFEAESTSEFAKSAALWTAVAGPDDRRTLAVRVLQAQSLVNQAKARDAERVLADALPRIKRTMKDDDPLLLAALIYQVSVDRFRGRIAEAEAHALELRKRGPDNDDFSQIDLLSDLIGICTSKFGSLDTQTNLRLYGEVRDLARESSERATRRWGPESVATLRSLTTLADMDWRLGDVDEAVQTAQSVLQRCEGRVDHCHATYVNAQDVLASALHRQGHSAEAADLLIERINCIRARDGVSIALLAGISDALPMIESGGRWSEGEALAKECAAALKQLGGGHGAMVFETDLWVARFVSLQGRDDEADALFAALFEREQEAAVEYQALARLHLDFACHLIRKQDFDRAEQQLKTAAAGLSDVRLGTCYANPDDVITGFIALYNAWGKPDEAAKYQTLQKESLEIAVGLR